MSHYISHDSVKIYKRLIINLINIFSRQKSIFFE